MTFDQQIAQCIEKLSRIDKHIVKKHTEQLKSVILNKEVIEAFAPGAAGLLCATNRRVFCISENLSGSAKSFLEFPYSKISSVESKTGMAAGKLVLNMSNTKKEFKHINNQLVTPFANHITRRVSESGASEEPATPESTPVVSKLDALERLGKLKDQGVLTEEEFLAEKGTLFEQEEPDKAHELPSDPPQASAQDLSKQEQKGPSSVLTALLIIFIFPIGLYYMWRRGHWPILVRGIITFAFLSIFFDSYSNYKDRVALKNLSQHQEIVQTTVPADIQLSASPNIQIIGAWYDDVGSPGFFDSIFTIYSEEEQYFIHRKNGDGSEGIYDAEKSGNRYTKIGDQNGAYYVVTEKGLDLNDRSGFIRTANVAQ